MTETSGPTATTGRVQHPEISEAEEAAVLAYREHRYINQVFRDGYDAGEQARAAVAARVAPPGGHREGIVEVYDWDGNYRGCMGVRRWEELLAADRLAVGDTLWALARELQEVRAAIQQARAALMALLPKSKT